MTVTEKAFVGLTVESKSLSEEQLRSRENMKNLCREYNDSADRLKERVDELKARLDSMPLSERKKAEKRIEVLEQEIRESRRTGADAGGFYLPGHRFLPHQNKIAYHRIICYSKENGIFVLVSFPRLHLWQVRNI